MSVAAIAAAGLCVPVAYAQEVRDPLAELEQLKQRMAEQSSEMDALRRTLNEQQESLNAFRRMLRDDTLSHMRGGTAAPGRSADAGGWGTPPMMAQNATPPDGGPVGRAPERDGRPPEIAPIFDQPGVLTPASTFVFEPSLQFGYSSNNRVALVGYTIIPALLIGLIDVREVKITSLVGAATFRYGLTNRLEIEARIPYVYTSSSTVSREPFIGTAGERTFDARGHALGDAEVTVRYQINDGGIDKAYYVGWLRFKSRTGKDPFEVETDCVTRCVGNTTGTGLPLSMPTGSGFYAIQPGLTWLYPSDPVVFFGSVSYLYNFKRNGVSRTVLNGEKEFIGSVAPGGIIGFNFGMGLALNDKASFSIGYDQSIVGKTKQNGQTVPGSVRTVLGTLLVGYSYRLSDKRTLNLSIGAGLTRDTPDLTVTLRLPMTF
ncbi:MAG TPA: acetate kinase [Burkholderiaceae bacterium]|nr:acetate kinase [Burkholderiaceae bacterium]